MSGGDETTIHVRAAVSGKTESVGWLVERFSPLLSITAKHRMGEHLVRHHSPEDVVAELWLTVLPKLGSIHEREGRFTPVLLRFLATTLRGQINNLARKHARRALVSTDAPMLEETPSKQAGPFTDAIGRATRNEDSLRLSEALMKLDPLDRQIVIHRAIEGEKNVVVADRLEMPPKTCASRYARALESLRSTVRGSVFDEIDEDD